jgi:hypothetical protein
MTTVTKGAQHTGKTFFEMMKTRFREEMEDRREMHLQVGRTIVALSDIEQYLAAFFAMFSLPVPEVKSEKMFYAAHNFSRKLELVDYAVKRSPETDLHKPWNEISERIKQQKVIRNIAAHASLYFKQEKGAARSKAIISGASVGSGAKALELGIPDVKKAADELEDIKSGLLKFYSPTLRTIIHARNIPLDPM